jgi:hypothetical protein
MVTGRTRSIRTSTRLFDRQSLEYPPKTGFTHHSLDFYGLDVWTTCMKQYDDRYDYFDKLRELIALLLSSHSKG